MPQAAASAQAAHATPAQPAVVKPTFTRPGGTPSGRVHLAVTAAALLVAPLDRALGEAVQRSKHPGSYGPLEAEHVRDCARRCRLLLAELEAAEAELDAHGDDMGSAAFRSAGAVS